MFKPENPRATQERKAEMLYAMASKRLSPSVTEGDFALARQIIAIWLGEIIACLTPLTDTLSLGDNRHTL